MTITPPSKGPQRHQSHLHGCALADRCAGGLDGGARLHWPTDVLAGWTAGLVWAILCWLAATWLQRRGAVESEGAEPLAEEVND